MRSILLAFQFLTRLPIRITAVEPSDHGCSMMWFPLVGLFIGLILVLITYETSLIHLPGNITAALLVLALVIITGGLHLDGLSDTCDGFYAGKNREEILQIMHDPHAGAMGIIGPVVVLLLQFSLLTGIINSLPLREQYICLAITPMISRWGMVLASAISPPARESTTGRSFIENIKPIHWIIATIITCGVSIHLLWLSGFALCLIGLLTVVIAVIYIRPRIGGMTGDTLGAINEIIGIVILFSAYLIYRKVII